ncbi:hypothetical protein FOH38_17795 [Lysinibacillus fusiformis]|nr:hypothetical protein FOH38_17795 [Lysinibacillus fusiformis]
MVIIVYVLIGLYAFLTGIAGMMQWKAGGFQVRAFLFVVVSIGMFAILFIPNKDWTFIWLVLAFVLLQIVAVAEGMLTNGRLTYSHHIIRLIFHCIIALLVYIYIK